MQIGHDVEFIDLDIECDPWRRVEDEERDLLIYSTPLSLPKWSKTYCIDSELRWEVFPWKSRDSCLPTSDGWHERDTEYTVTTNFFFLTAKIKMSGSMDKID